jgi:hypothetical protein
MFRLADDGVSGNGGTLVTGGGMIAAGKPDLPRRRSFAEWREMVQFSCGRLRVTGTAEEMFHGDMTLFRLGTVDASLISADAHAVVRPVT